MASFELHIFSSNSISISFLGLHPVAKIQYLEVMFLLLPILNIKMSFDFFGTTRTLKISILFFFIKEVTPLDKFSDAWRDF